MRIKLLENQIVEPEHEESKRQAIYNFKEKLRLLLETYSESVINHFKAFNTFHTIKQ